MNKLVFPSFILFVLLFCFHCGDNSSDDNDNNNNSGQYSTVYSAGYYLNGGVDETPAYWYGPVGGTVTIVPLETSGTKGRANSIVGK